MYIANLNYKHNNITPNEPFKNPNQIGSSHKSNLYQSSHVYSSKEKPINFGKYYHKPSVPLQNVSNKLKNDNNKYEYKFQAKKSQDFINSNLANQDIQNKYKELKKKL